MTRATLRLHAVLAVGLTAAGIADVVEWRRALAGHTLAWAYVGQWPLFAVIGTWVWWRLLNDELGREQRTRMRRVGRHDIAADDPGLVAWQEHLARVRAADPSADRRIGPP